MSDVKDTHCPLCGYEFHGANDDKLKCELCEAKKCSIAGVPLGYLYPEEGKVFEKFVKFLTGLLVLLGLLFFVSYWFFVYPLLPK
jgi:hypothetical protein